MKRLATLTLLACVISLGASVLSLDEAWRVAEQNSPALRQQDDITAAAHERLQSAHTARLPMLFANAGYQYMSELSTMQLLGNSIELSQHDRWDLALQAKQPLFTGWRVSGAIEAARADTLFAAAGKQLASDRLRLQIASLYCQAQALDASRAALQRAIERADSQLERVRAMLAAAQATPLDTLEIANRRLELETAVSANLHERAICLAQLEELVGEPVEPAPLSPVEIAPLDADDWVEPALSARPEFTSVEAQSRQAGAQRRMALSGLYPQVSAVAEYHYANPGVEMVNPDWNDYYVLGVQMQWNVWDWGQSRHNAGAAKYSQRRVENERQRLQDQVRRELRETVERLNSLADRIEMQQRLVDQESQRRDVIQSRFEQGQSSSLDLRDAENRVTEAELTLAQHIAQWRQARFQLDYYTSSIGGEQ